jgi:hypothetical protein
VGDFLLQPRLFSCLQGLSGEPEARLHLPAKRGNLEFLRIILDILAKCMVNFVDWAASVNCEFDGPEYGSKKDPAWLLKTCKYLAKSDEDAVKLLQVTERMRSIKSVADCHFFI